MPPLDAWADMDQQNRTPHADRMLAVIRNLSFCRSLPQVMEIVRREARSLTGADGVTFVLRDGDQCHYAEEDAIGPLWKGRRFPIRTCISGWVMLNRQVAAIPDIYVDPRIPIDAYRPTFVKSLLMVPVRAEDPLGAIGAYWATNHHASEQETHVLQSIADASALAIENVRLYESLQEAVERSEALNRAKDEWISLVSHELRTPLTPILGWTKMLRSMALDEARRQHGLEVIERNVSDEIRIVDDLLEVSRLMLGTARIEARALDVRTPIRAAIDRVAAEADRKGVALSVAMPDAEVPVVGDAQRLQQAAWNLVSNAVKFTPAGGRIEVTVARADGQASIIVRDTGQGIEAGVLPRLFGRFARADCSMSRADGGLGLGLFIVRRVAELHDGSVTADSAGPGLGSTFAIHLPLHVAHTRDHSPDVEATRAPRRSDAQPAADRLAPEAAEMERQV